MVEAATAFVPAVQEALRLAFYTVVAGFVALVMWKSGWFDAPEGA